MKESFVFTEYIMKHCVRSPRIYCQKHLGFSHFTRCIQVTPTDKINSLFFQLHQKKYLTEKKLQNEFFLLESSELQAKKV